MNVFLKLAPSGRTVMCWLRSKDVLWSGWWRLSRVRDSSSLSFSSYKCSSFFYTSLTFLFKFNLLSSA